MDSPQAWPLPSWALVRTAMDGMAQTEARALGVVAALVAADARLTDAAMGDDDLAIAITALQNGPPYNEAARRAEAATERLDQRAFQIREEAEDRGDGIGGTAYEEAFATARAAAAVSAALRGDSLRAAYEARFAVEDEQTLLATLFERLGLSL